MRSRDSKGFTVVELLVVMAVLAVLFSLLLPVMSGVMRNSRNMICQSNERAICQAMFQYAAAYNGWLPCPSVIGETDHLSCWDVPNGGQADFTNGTIWPYLGTDVATRQKTLKCPSDSNECLPKVGDSFYPPGNFSYSLNAQIRWSWYNTPAPNITFPVSTVLQQIKNPSLHGMVFEEFAPNDALCCGPGDGDDLFTGRHGPYGTADYRDSYYEPKWLASGAGNVGYFDGHVATIPTSDFQNNINQIFSPID